MTRAHEDIVADIITVETLIASLERRWSVQQDEAQMNALEQDLEDLEAELEKCDQASMY